VEVCNFEQTSNRKSLSFDFAADEKPITVAQLDQADANESPLNNMGAGSWAAGDCVLEFIAKYYGLPFEFGSR
jgi:hypothetical protein